MIILPCMWGGFGNNLHQIGNALTFLKKYNIDIDYLRIISKYENRYDDNIHPKQSKKFIFKELEKYFIDDFNLENVEKLYSNNRYDKIEYKDKDYILHPDFAANHRLLYDFLNVNST